MRPEEELRITSELDAIDPPTQTQAGHLSIEPKKKRHIVRGIIVTLLVLAFLAAAGYIGWLLVKPLEPAKQAATSAATPALTAEALVTEMKAEMLGEVVTTVQGDGNTPAKSYSAPAFRPDGYDFSVWPTSDSGFVSYGAQSTARADLRSIETILKERGLTLSVLDPGSDVGMYAADYQSDNIICIVTDQKALTISDRYSAAIGCADKASYVAHAKTLKPYFTAYTEESGNDAAKVLMGGLTTKASKTAGYSTASISIGGSDYGSVGGFAGLFYVTPDNRIHYFTGTQSQLLCEDYSTTPLKEAYLGESCYDAADTSATVTL